MKHGMVAVLLAVGVLPVAACTGNGQPSARAGSAARANAAHASAARAGAVTANGCAGQPAAGLGTGRVLPGRPAHAACARRGRQHRGDLVGQPRRTALAATARQEQQDPLGVPGPAHGAGSAGHQGHARRQRAHGDQVRAGWPGHRSSICQCPAAGHCTCAGPAMPTTSSYATWPDRCIPWNKKKPGGQQDAGRAHQC
jgi:hypothetical protein